MAGKEIVLFLFESIHKKFHLKIQINLLKNRFFLLLNQLLFITEVSRSFDKPKVFFYVSQTINVILELNGKTHFLWCAAAIKYMKKLDLRFRLIRIQTIMKSFVFVENPFSFFFTQLLWSSTCRRYCWSTHSEVK